MFKQNKTNVNTGDKSGSHKTQISTENSFGLHLDFDVNDDIKSVVNHLQNEIAEKTSRISAQMEQLSKRLEQVEPKKVYPSHLPNNVVSIKQ
jgi:hypothetical protein